ncbi:MAG: toast rack family protein [Candidatus Cryosericum sp.]
MRGLAIFLLIVFLIVGALYATNALTGNAWWEPRTWSRPAAGNVITDARTIDLRGAHTALVELQIGAGRVTLSGGASELMNATFTYNVIAWKPIVDYVINGDEGRLLVRQPSGTYQAFSGSYHNDWNMRLSKTTPVDLTIKNGAGNIDVDLSDTMVRTLTVNSGASSTTIKACPKAMTSLTVKAGVGEVGLDLTGAWKNSVDVEVNGGVGSIRLVVPENIGVTINAQRGLGSVDATGFTRNGATYRNAAYGSSAITLSVNLNVGVGSVTITQK